MPSYPQFTGFVDQALLSAGSKEGAVLELTGWMLSLDAPLQQLMVGLVDGEVHLATLFERRDVAGRFPDVPHALRSGFKVTLPVPRRESSYVVRLVASLSNGSRITTQIATTVSSVLDVQDISEHDARIAMDVSLRTRFEAFISSKAELAFHRVVSPRVSVVIPVLGQAPYLLNVLECVRSESLDCALEVVIVDNASASNGSGDDVAQVLSRITGITTIVNERNLGFSRACNQGAAQSRGEFLLFLNTDCMLIPGAIRAAVDFLEKNPHVGAVGGTLIRAHGKLAEAGSFVLPNGTTVPRGRGGHRSSARYDVPIVADFCSAALLLTPRSTFLQMNGFFEGYDPAYYEDVDYCTRLKERGLPTVALPTVNAIHIERRSSADSNAVDLLMSRHRQLFVDRNEGALLSRSCRELLKPGAVVLFIEDSVPAPHRGQGQGRSRQLLTNLFHFGLQVRLYPVKGHVAESSSGFQIVRPPSPSEEEAFLRQQLQEVDGVFVCRPPHMDVVQTLLRSVNPLTKRPLVVYDAEALQSKREVLKIEALRDIQLSDSEIIEIACNEIVVATDADVILAVSDDEAAAFRDFGFANVSVVGFACEPRPTQNPFDARRGMLTVGPMLEPDTPNADGVRWFNQEVLPYLRQLMKPDECFLHVIGENRVPELDSLQSDNFKLLGALRDLLPAYERYRVFIAPTRFAAGIPIKVIEAAAAGIPMVTTPLIASQLGWRDEEELLVGFSPQDFAAKCAALHVNTSLWEHLRNNALRKVREQFDPLLFEKSLRQAVMVVGE